jgi:PAS domain S-box-containing protein
MPMKWFLDKAFTNDEAEVLKTIAKTANEGIWIIDINGDTLFVNAKMAHALGYGIDELHNINIYEIICEECEADIKKPKILEDRHEICLKHKSGQARVFSINTSTFFGPNGEYLGSLGMLSDITDIKINAAELKRQKKILQSVMEAGNRLFLEKDILKALEGVVATIGAGFDATRCCIYGKGLLQSFIETKIMQLAVYEDKDARLCGKNYDFFKLVSDEEKFADVFGSLNSGICYEGGITDPKEPMSSFAGYGIGYVFIVPLFIGDELWGFFGIGKGLKHQPLDREQKSALEAMSKNIASSVEKFFVTKQLGNAKLELLCVNQNLEAAAMMAINDKLKIEQENLNRQKELFAIKEKYHLLQQDDAYNKQIKILVDDLSHKRVDGFLFESFYKPLDILSGDIYGMIKISESSFFLYIIDAMGKGLSASVTAIISASFINNMVDVAAKSGSFMFRQSVEEYQSFIKKQINEEEMVCAVFVHIDDISKKIEIANFSMPEILLKRSNGELVAKKANNYPITSYFSGVNIDSFCCADVEGILISSDGLKDTKTQDGGVYKDSLYKDFLESATKNIFLKKLFSKALNPEDDLTFIFLSRYNPSVKLKNEFEILPSIEAIVECVDVKLRSELSGYFDGKTLMQVEYALNELLMNALEHGTLNISYTHKHALLESHMFDEFLEENIQKIENAFDKKIKISLEEVLLKNRKAVIIRIKDKGTGFDVGTTLKSLSLDKNLRFNGRGILMSDNVLDALFYNEAGNEASMIKFLEGN